MKKHDKAIPKKPSFGQNLGTESLRRAYMILIYLKESSYFPTQIASRIGIKRQVLQYWIRKLEDEGLVYCTNPESNKFKLYQVTPAGQSFIAANDGTVRPKGKVTGENSRFKCEIRNLGNLHKFLTHNEYRFKQNNTELKYNIVYHGKVGGVDVTVRHPARTIDHATMEIRSPQFSANSGNEAIYLMFNMMIRFQDWLDEKWQLNLSRLKLDSDHIELAWDSPYAKAKMTQTKGSPIRTPFFKINQSPPTLKPKEEWHDPDELDRHLLLPDIVDQIKKEVQELKTDNVETRYKIDQFEQSIRSLAESTKSIVEYSKNNDKNMADIATKLTELVNINKEKQGQPESKIEQKEISGDATRMFQ
jgi:DNA-binding MarR family transcriptional regulator